MDQRKVPFPHLAKPYQTIFTCDSCSGLGALLATTFASHGCNIAINYFNRLEPAQAIQKECESHGVKAIVIKADMTSTSEAERAVTETLEGLGGLDIILANAVSV